MRINNTLAIGLAALLAGCGGDKQSEMSAADGPGWRIATEGDLNAFFDCLADEGAALVSAHRGGPYPGYPENAIETMEALLDAAPAVMEIDVATSADGVLYLMHDDTLERTTTGEGATNASPWYQIARLHLEDDDGEETAFAPPRFDEVLRWAAGRTILEVDFKQSTHYEGVASEIRRQHAEGRVILIAYSLAQAKKLHRLLPEAMISLNINSQSELNEAVAAGVPADRLLGFTGVEAPRPHLFSALGDRDVEVIFGTLGGRDSIDSEIARTGDNGRYAELANDGVDLIATDRPKAAYAALAAAGRAPKAGTCGVSYGG